MALYTKFQKILTTIKNVNVIKLCNYDRRISYLVYKKTKQNLFILHNPKEISAEFHLSPYNFKIRKTKADRKTKRSIEYPSKVQKFVDVWKDITVGELAKIFNRDVNYVQDIFLNQVKGAHTVISDIKFLQTGIRRSGHRMRIIAKPRDEVKEIIIKDAFPRPPPLKSELKPRPPVVTVMGHVDHGKTTLLDALRHSKVVEQEFGGITQHIGAFSVVLDTGARITFLDTPGHAAFKAMRARGASVTDIVVLVVAADDGVMEQTLESIRMAKEARVPILVAINKIDARKADVQETERMLINAGIQVENQGGDVQSIAISALKRQNLDKLTEALVLQAEMLEIGADPTGPVEAVVIESRQTLDKGKLCTVVVQRGILKKGNILVAGTAMAKVRALRDANGINLKEVSPGYPAEIEGWRDLPSAGETVLEVESEQRAREVIKVRENTERIQKHDEELVLLTEKQAQHEKVYKANLDERRRAGHFRSRQKGPRQPEIPKDDAGPTLNLIIKADVDGSLEALLNTLDSYDLEDCKLDLIHYGVGDVNETDIEFAKTFNGVIYAFNVKCPKHITEIVEKDKITLKHHNVIYKLIDDVKEEINKRLIPGQVEEILGEAVVLRLFDVNVKGKKIVPVLGCRCTKGTLQKSAMYKVLRNGETLHTGNLSSMRHLKNEVDTIKTDVECGLQMFDKSVDFAPGDVVICYRMKPKPQVTEWDPGF